MHVFSAGKMLVIVTSLIWIMGIGGGLNLIGILGAGYQLRFLLPIIPASAFLLALCLEDFLVSLRNSMRSSAGIVLIFVVTCYSCLHALYYGVLFGPLYGDMPYSIMEIINDAILAVPKQSFKTAELAMDMQKYMEHYGLKMG